MTVSSPGRAGSDQRRGRIRAVGLGFAAFVAGLATAGLLSNREPAAAKPGSVVDSRTPKPSSADIRVRGLSGHTAAGGGGDGFPHTEQGAVSAAAAFVTTGQSLLDVDPLAAEEAVRRMAASATADAQVKELLARLASLREDLSSGTGPTVYRQSPISWRVDGFTPERARVAVWSVGILARDGVAPPQAGWAISAFDLVWERGDWRIWSETVTPGPAPLADNSAPPATSAQFTAALRGFADFGAGR